MNLKKCEAIFQIFYKNNPHPQTELKYHSHFELLIAVMLSAQATDISVNKATEQLYPIANTPEKILALGIEKLKSYIRTIGLYNTKAQHIIQTCAILIEQHHSKVPHDRQSLEKLPGVGRKTANVILNTAFGESTIAVDTHIFRVANRTKLANGKTPLMVEQQLLKIIPTFYLHNAHHWLVLHGRYICTAKKPKCATCPIIKFCEWEEKNI